nr:hypothetical protein [uncultured Flavobacterium sp.]
MKRIAILVFVICNTFAACSNDDSTSQEEDNTALKVMYDEIISLSLIKSLPCTNPEEWAFTGIGARPCGGVDSYIPYAKGINITAFETKVKAYNNAVEAFNKKWELFSTCEVTSVPKAVACVEGKPTLIYQ